MKVNYCLIGMTLLFSSIYMSLENRKTDHFKKFYNLLDAGQKNKYESIVKERMMIYLGGILLGTALGYFYYTKNKGNKYLFCKVLVISYLTKLGFYYFFPKSPLMLYSLYSKDQTDAWADIYSEMKNRWIKSLVVGFFAYISLTAGLLK
tara:strand:- start:93 stop:539 length:447 start_codon:yes stop_codon:yes gene_type:complete